MDDFDFRVGGQGEAWTEANPLCMRGLKPRLATARELGFTFPDWMREQLPKIRTPFLVLHGATDKVTDPGVSKQLFDEAPVKDKQIKLYEGAFHCELLCCTKSIEKFLGKTFLPEQLQQTEECLRDMAAWIEARA